MTPRLILGDDIAPGPGKVQRLETIRETGSIAAAGRSMNISDKRAWHLVDTMNRCFSSPLVEASKGGDPFALDRRRRAGRIPVSWLA
jgi:molybdate transport system regulatory protein